MKLPSTPEEWAEFHEYFRIREGDLQRTAPRRLRGRTDWIGLPLPVTPLAFARSILARQIRWRCPWISKSIAVQWANDLIVHRGVCPLRHTLRNMESMHRRRRRHHA